MSNNEEGDDIECKIKYIKPLELLKEDRVNKGANSEQYSEDSLEQEVPAKKRLKQRKVDI